MPDEDFRLADHARSQAHDSRFRGNDGRYPQICRTPHPGGASASSDPAPSCRGQGWSRIRESPLQNSGVSPAATATGPQRRSTLALRDHLADGFPLGAEGARDAYHAKSRSLLCGVSHRAVILPPFAMSAPCAGGLAASRGQSRRRGKQQGYRDVSGRRWTRPHPCEYPPIGTRRTPQGRR
jgi:hypothetical protein